MLKSNQLWLVNNNQSRPKRLQIKTMINNLNNARQSCLNLVTNQSRSILSLKHQLCRSKRKLKKLFPWINMLTWKWNRKRLNMRRLLRRFRTVAMKWNLYLTLTRLLRVALESKLPHPSLLIQTNRYRNLMKCRLRWKLSKRKLKLKMRRNKLKVNQQIYSYVLQQSMVTEEHRIQTSRQMVMRVIQVEL